MATGSTLLLLLKIRKRNARSMPSFYHPFTILNIFNHLCKFSTDSKSQLTVRSNTLQHNYNFLSALSTYWFKTMVPLNNFTIRQNIKHNARAEVDLSSLGGEGKMMDPKCCMAHMSNASSENAHILITWLYVWIHVWIDKDIFSPSHIDTM